MKESKSPAQIKQVQALEPVGSADLLRVLKTLDKKEITSLLLAPSTPFLAINTLFTIDVVC